MKILKSIDEFDVVVGRGQMFIVSISDDKDIPKRDEVVEIDGHRYTVRRVEMAVGLTRRKEVGLIVTRLKDDTA